VAQHSSYAVVLLRVDPAQEDFDVNLMAYDEAAQSLGIHLFTDAIRFHIPGAIQSNGMIGTSYVALVAKPGTYVFQDIVQQHIWGLCFNNSSLAFTLNPGDVVFLGNLNNRVHLGQLQRLAVAHHEVTAPNGAMKDFFDPEILPPQVTRPGLTTPDFLEAKRYEAANMPTSNGRLKPVEYRPAKFGVGYVWTGEKVCGGLMRNDPKPGG